MYDGSDFMTNGLEGAANDDDAWSVDPDVDSGFNDPTASFDPIVLDALQGTDDMTDLIDETVKNLPVDPGPASGPFAGLAGGVPGGSGTEDLVGFINGRGADISGMIGQVEAGQDLTDEQIASGEHIAGSGINFDPLLQGDEMHNRTMDDIERFTFGNTQTDSSGQTWHYSPETHSWYKVGADGGLDATDEIPPFQRQPPAGWDG